MPEPIDKAIASIRWQAGLPNNVYCTHDALQRDCDQCYRDILTHFLAMMVSDQQTRIDRLERHLTDDHHCNCLTPEERQEYIDAVKKNPTAPVTTMREEYDFEAAKRNPYDLSQRREHPCKKGGPPGPLDKHRK